VTRSKDGMTLITKPGEVTHIKARVHEVYDVSGAGDTAIATLALGLASGLPCMDAAALANMAAGIVVGRLGTAVIAAQDLKTELFVHERTSGTHKILTLLDAKAQVERWKREGKTVGFTNGCFDLLHPGHVQLLCEARSHCDRLVVGLNSDASVKRLKGPTRPVQPEAARSIVLAGLAFVDAVVLFADDTPIELIARIKPDILVKGADYRIDQVVGHDIVESYGGRVVLVDLLPASSTTLIIDRLKAEATGAVPDFAEVK